MPLKRRRAVILVLLRSAVFSFFAFLILRWTWSRGMLPVGVGSVAATITILLDFWRQIGKIDHLDQPDSKLTH
jgi:hypothetical protein